jgi:hypothetical protein
MKLLFPANYIRHRYANIHFMYYIVSAQTAGIAVELVPPSDTVWVGMVDNECRQPNISCELDGDQIIIDFMDHVHADDSSAYHTIPYFKAQYDPNKNTNSNCFPVGPIYATQFNNNEFQQYHEYLTKHKPANPGGVISNRQRIHGSVSARERRLAARQLLLTACGTRVDVPTSSDVYELSITNYWKRLMDCFIAVCIPGASINSFDRNQMECMGLGVCTISPELHIQLAGGVTPLPGVHYVKCANDFSDIAEVIRWCDLNTLQCEHIGNNAKQLFVTYGTPAAVWSWIAACVNTMKSGCIR